MLWLRGMLDHETDECVIFPFARHRSGCAIVFRDGKNLWLHRYVCERVKGPPPTPKHEAAHSCGNGPKGCVNPRHLSWKTKSENQLDRNHKGSPRHKLTPIKVAEIRALTGAEPVHITGARYGVTENTIRQIQTWKTWRYGVYHYGGNYRPTMRETNK